PIDGEGDAPEHPEPNPVERPVAENTFVVEGTEDGGWLRVRREDGSIGYVKASYVSVSTVPEPDASTQATVSHETPAAAPGGGRLRQLDNLRFEGRVAGRVASLSFNGTDAMGDEPPPIFTRGALLAIESPHAPGIEIYPSSFRSTFRTFCQGGVETGDRAFDEK